MRLPEIPTSPPAIFELPIGLEPITKWRNENGGIPLRSRVGHSYIKKMMAENDAIFGGEHSGHFYFKDFWNADSGMLAALHAIAALLEEKKSLSQLLERLLIWKNRFLVQLN